MPEVEFSGGHAIEQTERPSSDGITFDTHDEAKKAVQKALDEEEAKSKPKKAPKKDDKKTDEPDVDYELKQVKKKAKDSEESDEESASKKHSKPPIEGAADDDSDSQPDADDGESDEDVEEDDEDVEEDKLQHKKSPKEDDEDDKALRKVLNNRAKIAKEKAKAAEEHQRIQAEFARQRAELEAQARQIEEGRRQLQSLRTNPVEAVRAAGYDPEQFILDLAQSGTPEGRQAEALRKIQEQQALQAQQWQAYLRQQQEAYDRAQYNQAVMARQDVETRFIKKAFDPKTSPHTAAFYKGQEAQLIAQGDVIAKQYQELTGKVAQPEEIAEYIEEQLAERAQAWYKLTEKSRKAAQIAAEEDDSDTDEEAETEASGDKGKRPKVNKTIESSPKERRAVTKNLQDLDEDELKELAKARVQEAISKVKKRPND